MTITITEQEKELIEKMALNAIANGNTAYPKAYDPTTKEYELLHKLMIKLKGEKA